MNRWGVRIMGLILLLMFMLLFLNLKKQLVMIQQMQGKPASTTAPPR
jgi:hypothetical protein